MGDPINVVLAADENYAQHMSVVLASILAHTVSRVCFYILHNGVSQETRNKIIALVDGIDCELKFVEVNVDIFSGQPRPDTISEMGFARLMAPQLLDVDKIIYFDCDVVVKHDICDLWNIDLEGHPIAACLDFISPRKIQIENVAAENYFNSGVLVMDLDYFRKNEWDSQYLTFIRKNDKYYNGDQDILNIFFSRSWKRLPDKWNVHSNVNLGHLKKYGFYDVSALKDAVKNPWCIHYTSVKPWHYAFRGRFRKEYWRYLELTEYRGYKYPTPSFRDRLERHLPRFLRRMLHSYEKRMGASSSE